MAEHKFQVTGMTCGHCEMSVREEVGEIAGVEAVQVSFETGALVVTAPDALSDEQIFAAVEEAGFSAVRA